MSRHFRTVWALILVVATSATGCHPTQPFYLNEDGDLSHYIDSAMEVEDPILDHQVLPDAEQALDPITLSNSDNVKLWDLSLEDVISMSLQNNKVLVGLGTATRALDGRSIIPDQILSRPEITNTIYDPAIFETDPQAGVAAALSEFDAQFTTQAFWQKTDRPQNINTASFPFVPVVLQQDLGQLDMQVQKRSASGPIFAARSQTIFDDNNRGFGRALPSDWFQALEAEARIPMLRGAGTQINRLPVVLARTRTDISLAEFEQGVRNMVKEVEFTYWDLNAVYRTLETSIIGRDAALAAWRRVDLLAQEGNISLTDAARAKVQYYTFRAQVEQSWRDILNTENTLRFLMGIAPTDDRGVIRPKDDPSTARVEFDWCEIRTESLVRSADLRRQKWQVKQRELQLIAARNQLLPQVNVTLLYRWLGLGDNFGLGQERTGESFPDPHSQAWEVLADGAFQESRVGIEFVPPRFGARRELGAIRNAQLSIAREKARLETMELTVVHTLTQAVRDLDTQYLLAQTNFNRLDAAKEEVDTNQALIDGGKGTVEILLDAQQRRAQAQVEFYRAVANYNKAIAEVHYRKGSLLDYNGIQLQEGPWPKKAYWDALGHARQRDASIYLDYGWSRPRVISEGPINQNQDTDDGTRGATPKVFSGEQDGNAAPPVIDEVQPEPMLPEAAAPRTLPSQARRDTFDWGGLGLAPANTPSQVRQVSYEN